MHRHVVTLFVMFCVVVILVTTHYLVWDMRAIWWRLQQLKSWHKRKAYLCGRWKGGSMLTPSWMNIHNGNLADSTTCSFFTGCSCMLQLLGERTWLSHPLGLVTALTWARLGGRAICHRACWPWVNQRRDKKGIQWCIPATEVAWQKPLWWGDEGMSPTNTSSVSGILHYWRNWDAPPVPPDMTPGQI